jgi:serine/threonine-protein kinase
VLKGRARGDEQLVREVEALLTADAAPHGALDGSALELLQELRDEPPAERLCGVTFGPYRVDEHLSSGGMGHVYRATRMRAGTERRVALKVLRPGLDTEAFLQRFQRERELLAALEHEHVVAFLDAGALPDGRPYLVMEYVEGEPLTQWGRRVPLRARLELLLQVLAAVQYAHQQLVVHRDLKPQNVLVTAQGAPKLLDFGVATALEAEGEGGGAHAPLTPTYASPEQLRGEPLTTASDVYSLGLLLHELVTGELPGVRAVTLGGDLGAIARKALAAAPALRYRSADHLADDLRRHLASEPVSARPATWTYRAGRCARRNRWPLALAAAVVVAVVAGWVGADLDRRHAQQEAALGWGAHGQAKVVSRLLEDWIAGAAASDGALGADAAAYLEAALRDDLTDLPEASTLVRLALARLYLARGERERAAAHAERAFELARTTRGIGQADRERAAELRARARGDG